jgi:hypothetical protein
MTAWGFDNGSLGGIATFMQRAKQRGYRCVSLEYDAYGNDARWSVFKDAAHQQLLFAGTWVTNSQNIRACPADTDFIVGELEDEDDYQGLMAARDFRTDIPRAVITNFVPLVDANGYKPEKAKPLIDAGFDCLTECYMGVSTNFSPDRMDFVARVMLGWPTSQPVFGTYGKPLSEYAQWQKGGWGVYLAEYEY